MMTCPTVRLKRLSGFGLEDTHCGEQSALGPDGWLYACQGSTVTGNIVIHGLTENR